MLCVIVAATNLPEALDSALFRRFDDIINYPFPGQAELRATFEKHLKGLKFSEELVMDSLVEHAVGLSYADVIRACQDAIKEMLVNDRDKVSINSLFSFLDSKRTAN